MKIIKSQTSLRSARLSFDHTNMAFLMSVLNPNHAMNSLREDLNRIVHHFIKEPGMPKCFDTSPRPDGRDYIQLKFDDKHSFPVGVSFTRVDDMIQFMDHPGEYDTLVKLFKIIMNTVKSKLGISEETFDTIFTNNSLPSCSKENIKTLYTKTFDQLPPNENLFTHADLGKDGPNFFNNDIKSTPLEALRISLDRGILHFTCVVQFITRVQTWLSYPHDVKSIDLTDKHRLKDILDIYIHDENEITQIDVGPSHEILISTRTDTMFNSICNIKSYQRRCCNPKVDRCYLVNLIKSIEAIEIIAAAVVGNDVANSISKINRLTLLEAFRTCFDGYDELENMTPDITITGSDGEQAYLVKVKDSKGGSHDIESLPRIIRNIDHFYVKYEKFIDVADILGNHGRKLYREFFTSTRSGKVVRKSLGGRGAPLPFHRKRSDLPYSVGPSENVTSGHSSKSTKGQSKMTSQVAGNPIPPGGTNEVAQGQAKQSSLNASPKTTGNEGDNTGTKSQVASNPSPAVGTNEVAHAQAKESSLNALPKTTGNEGHNTGTKSQVASNPSPAGVTNEVAKAQAKESSEPQVTGVKPSVLGNNEEDDVCFVGIQDDTSLDEEIDQGNVQDDDSDEAESEPASETSHEKEDNSTFEQDVSNEKNEGNNTSKKDLPTIPEDRSHNEDSTLEQDVSNDENEGNNTSKKDLPTIPEDQSHNEEANSASARRGENEVQSVNKRNSRTTPSCKSNLPFIPEGVLEISASSVTDENKIPALNHNNNRKVPPRKPDSVRKGVTSKRGLYTDFLRPRKKMKSEPWDRIGNYDYSTEPSRMVPESESINAILPTFTTIERDGSQSVVVDVTRRSLLYLQNQNVLEIYWKTLFNEGNGICFTRDDNGRSYTFTVHHYEKLVAHRAPDMTVKFLIELVRTLKDEGADESLIKHVKDTKVLGSGLHKKCYVMDLPEAPKCVLPEDYTISALVCSYISSLKETVGGRFIDRRIQESRTGPLIPPEYLVREIPPLNTKNRRTRKQNRYKCFICNEVIKEVVYPKSCHPQSLDTVFDLHNLFQNKNCERQYNDIGRDNREKKKMASMITFASNLRRHCEDNHDTEMFHFVRQFNKQRSMNLENYDYTYKFMIQKSLQKAFCCTEGIPPRLFEALDEHIQGGRHDKVNEVVGLIRQQMQHIVAIAMAQSHKVYDHCIQGECVRGLFKELGLSGSNPLKTFTNDTGKSTYLVPVLRVLQKLYYACDEFDLTTLVKLCSWRRAWNYVCGLYSEVMYVENNESMPFFAENIFTVKEARQDIFGKDFDGHLLNWIRCAAKSCMHLVPKETDNDDDVTMDVGMDVNMELGSFGDLSSR